MHFRIGAPIGLQSSIRGRWVLPFAASNAAQLAVDNAPRSARAGWRWFIRADYHDGPEWTPLYD